MYLVPILLGAGCLAALWLASLAGARQVLVAQMLAGVWAGAFLAWHLNALWLLPLLDLAVGAVAMRFWLRDHAGWSLSIVLLILYRLAAHVVDWMTASHFFVGYAHTINALFALQLIVIASTGGADGRRRFIHWLRRVRDVGGMGPARTRGIARG